MQRNIKSAFLLTLSTLIATSCGGGGSSSSSSSTSGALTLGVTDAPVDDAEQVVIEFTGVEIHGSNGESITIDYDTPRQIDLLALQGGQRELLLDETPLNDGQYSWIRLAVNAEADNVLDSYIVIAGQEYEIEIPSGSETGLKLNNSFTIAYPNQIDFTVDFDLRSSITEANGEYLMNPTLRIIETDEAATLTGIVDPIIFNGQPCSANTDGYAVYLYDNSGDAPDDIGGTNAEPITTYMVSLNQNSQYGYTFAFLDAGTYRVAATCDGDIDDGDQNEPINFVGTQTITLTTGTTTTANF